MTTTARQATRTIATRSATLGDLVISGFDTCDLCPRTANYLYVRLDEDDDEVHVCEHCVNTADLSYIAD